MSLPLSPFTPLRLPASTKYLVSFHYTSSNCTVFLTDLTTLYRESLNAEEIVERAEVPFPLPFPRPLPISGADR